MTEKAGGELQPLQEAQGGVMNYESHYLFERQPCRECGSSNVFTRVYFHEKTMHSRWLCRNCSEDYIEKRGYQLLTVNYKV